MFARFLAVLSVLALLVLGWFVWSSLRSARELASVPAWPSKDSEPFRMRDGQSGAWDAHWDDVPGADGQGLLWFRTDPPVRELKDGTRILARAGAEGAAWIELGPEWDWNSAVRLDLHVSQHIEYRFEHAGDQLLDRRCELTVCGNCDSRAQMLATAYRARAVMAGFMLGVPLLTALGFALFGLRKRRA